jgi:hypothetical protein
MSSNRTRGITLQTIDMDALKEAIRPALEERYPKDQTQNFHFQYRLAFAEHNGKTYAINTEGVGSEVTEEKPFELALYAGLAMFPFATLQFTPERLAKAPKGEEVDLADFVRVFGDRLEVNFGIWHRTLSA